MIETSNLLPFLTDKLMNTLVANCKSICDTAQFVKIDLSAIEQFCSRLWGEEMKHRFDEAPFNIHSLPAEEKLLFLLLFNSISFSYRGNPKWTIEYRGQRVDGAYGMIACIGKAVEQRKLVLEARYLSQITKADFSSLLAGNVEIPLFEERFAIIREIATVLIEKFNGDIRNLIKLAEGDVEQLIALLIEHFPSFRDEAVYRGKNIRFSKRAQLFVADVYQGFRGQEWGNFHTISEITACADYKLPFVFRRLGMLSYRKTLADQIDQQKVLEKWSEEEIEIRASAIWIVELMRRFLQQRIPEVQSFQINDYIRLLGQQKLPTDKPYHRVRTTAY